MEGKNIASIIAVILLVVGIVVSNVMHVNRYSDAEEAYNEHIIMLYYQISSMRVTELSEVEYFISELDRDYIYIKTIEPVGFINYSLEYKGFRTTLYDVTFSWVTEEEANGSVELWLDNHTIDTTYMTFDVAVANNREPMKAGNIYNFYHVYNAYKFYNVIYYEKIETGRID